MSYGQTLNSGEPLCGLLQLSSFCITLSWFEPSLPFTSDSQWCNFCGACFSQTISSLLRFGAKLKNIAKTTKPHYCCLRCPSLFFGHGKVYSFRNSIDLVNWLWFFSVYKGEALPFVSAIFIPKIYFFIVVCNQLWSLCNNWLLWLQWGGFVSVWGGSRCVC